MSDFDLIRRLYQVFSPEPLRSDQQHLYVNLDTVRGRADVVHKLAVAIRLSERKTTQLLAGHSGCGKSTELLRLKHELETGNPPYFVVCCEADRDIDRNDVGIHEILIAIVRQVAEQVETRLAYRLQRGYFRDRWDRLKQLLLTKINFDDVTINAGLFEISKVLKNSPDVREQARRLLEPDTSNWLDAANLLLGEVQAALDKKGYRGLVVLVDDLDKMTVRPVKELNCSTAEALFVNRAEQLTALKAHVVYSIPLSLTRSLPQQQLKGKYDGEFPVVPMTKIRRPPPEGGTHKAGMELFRTVIANRLQVVDAPDKSVFRNDRIRNDLIRLTGGHLTALMIYMRMAVSRGLPISSQAVEDIRRGQRNDLLRQLRREHWSLLEAIAANGTYLESRNDEEAFRELLENRVIMQYVNDIEWYGVNPVLVGLDGLLLPQAQS